MHHYGKELKITDISQQQPIVITFWLVRVCPVVG
jgi:hypothetical protein